MQTAPSGAVWTLSDSSSELLTALFELLTARQSCSERVVLVIRVMVDGPAGPLWRGVMVCGCVMSCHVFMVTHLIPCIRTCHVT